MAILEKIKNISDIKSLSIKELEILAEEIRVKIIDTVKTNGGHLSSNLGVVETTLALYYTFDFEKDKLLFDVGHQSYTHKILSLGVENFSTLRKTDGSSGFPDPENNPLDAFIAGHAGNAIGAGLGIAKARDLKKEDYKIVCLVGDASLTNGVSLEALTEKNNKPNGFIVILNDNGMSISKNENGLYKSVIKGTTKKSYLKVKGGVKKIFGTSFIGRFLRSTKRFFRRVFNPNHIIDDLGFKYFGTANGHNLKELIKAFSRARDYGEAVLIRVKTVKGKGYIDAENMPSKYHGIGKDFNVSVNDFSSCAGETMVKIARENENVVAITAGMTDGVGLSRYSETYPNRFIDVGISEELAVLKAGGLAKEGIKPFVFIYSTFLQRAYDEIIHDISLLNLPVTFCIDRAGLVGFDGRTHQGVFDMAYLRHIPNMSVYAPKDLNELESAMEFSLTKNSPVAIRYPNGRAENFQEKSAFSESWEILKKSTDEKAVILACGYRAVKKALEVCKNDDRVTVINARCVKPLDSELLLSIKDKFILTVEDGALLGGFGSAVSEFYKDKGELVKVYSIGVKDEFIHHASVDEQLEYNGITVENILGVIKNNI